MLKIFWTEGAKGDLEDVYDFYKDKSIRGAKNVLRDILNIVKEIKFSEQYQVDEVDEKYRRMIVRHYKVLYSSKENIIYIHRVFDTRQHPLKQLKK